LAPTPGHVICRCQRVGAKIYGADPLTRQRQLGLHVRETGANTVGVGTHKLGAKDDGAELRVHFLK
jgi:hypothetical protein